MIRPVDREDLKRQFDSSRPYPHFVVDEFLEPESAREVAAAYPDFEAARRMGFEFKSVNEQRKVQVCDAAKFPPPVRRLNEQISSPSFLADLEYITGIPRLLADDQLAGGGMHLTGAGGRLDVHVDFNYLKERHLHRRLNILLYLNDDWRSEWGGEIELWDKSVKTLLRSMKPVLNRCLVFETTDISYHGVRPITAPPEVCRRSYAAYYYTREAPSHWQGKAHSTIFKARPEERLKGQVLMPAEKLKKGLVRAARATKRWIFKPGS
jgi:Rps23 Pro-64 3,4-dihydroxylase Tpa1-like proline 4-hydroxylase